MPKSNHANVFRITVDAEHAIHALNNTTLYKLPKSAQKDLATVKRFLGEIQAEAQTALDINNGIWEGWMMATEEHELDDTFNFAKGRPMTAEEISNRESKLQKLRQNLKEKSYAII